MTLPGVPVLGVADERRATASGQPIGTEARETLFIRQALVELSAPRTAWLTARAGRLATDAGTSLVYDDSISDENWGGVYPRP